MPVPTIRANTAPRVGFLVTCLVDLFCPSVGFAGIKLLEGAGCRVEVPRGQTCCGQMAYNSGDVAGARAQAKRVIAGFSEFDYIVAPSGSCAHMLKRRYPDLLADDSEWAPRVKDFSQRCFELTSFLWDMLGDVGTRARADASSLGVVTYHDSCVGLRELGIHAQPRALLRQFAGCEIREMAHANACCGFGGIFCLEYPEISTRLVSDKVAGIRKSGADTLLGGDMGCLLNIAGRLARLGEPCRVHHVVEVLAGRE